VSNIVPYGEIERMAQAIAKSGLFGIKTPEQAAALMLIANAEGMHPAIAARDFHVIQGRPALKADAMLARFQAAGGKVNWTNYMDQRVTAIFSHPSGGSVEIDWTIEQAKRAGLTGKDVWRQYPRAMLRARVISEGIRTVYPGVAVGVYTPEEIGDFDAKPGRVERDMGAAEVVEQEMPKGLLEAAQTAADGGRENFGTYWKALTPETRRMLAPHLDDLKARTEKTIESDAPAETAEAE
jgi:hypothetical protein